MDATSWTLIIIAVINILPSTIAAVAAWWARKAVLEAKGDIKLIEIATNSMKDALVKKTEEEALIRGAEAGRVKEVAREKATGEPK